MGTYDAQTPILSRFYYFLCTNLQKIRPTEPEWRLFTQFAWRYTDVIRQNYRNKYIKSKTWQQALDRLSLDKLDAPFASVSFLYSQNMWVVDCHKVYHPPRTLFWFVWSWGRNTLVPTTSLLQRTPDIGLSTLLFNHHHDQGIVTLLIRWSLIGRTTHHRRESNCNTSTVTAARRTSTPTTTLASASSYCAFKLYSTLKEHTRNLLLLHG